MDTPQNNMPQNNNHKIFSWMRRHPILSIYISINIIVGVLFVCFMVLKSLNTPPEDRCLLKNDIEACKEVCNKNYENEYHPDDYGKICRIACDNGNADACANTCGYADYEGDDSCSMACDKGKIPSCWRACFNFKDIKACRKACDNDRVDACAQVCNDDKDLKACKSACYDDHLDYDVRLEACGRVFLLTADKDKVTADSKASSILCSDNRFIMTCPYACNAGDSKSCAIMNEAIEREECHITNWRCNSNSNFDDFCTLQNVSWQSDPIKLRNSPCYGLCSSSQGYARDAELGREIKIPNYMQSLMTDYVFNCAKASNNTKLIDVAKKCDGKWF